ncbi:MAG: RDD family protein [Pseudomonadota bacterium]
MTGASTATQTRGSGVSVDGARQRALRKLRHDQTAKRERTLVTPEGAALTLTIGTFGERAGAFIIDFVIQWTVVLVVVFSVLGIAAQMGFGAWNIAGSFIGVFIFLFRNFYFVYFEMGRRSATPGKRLIGLRVAARNGGQLKANAVLARNFIREIEIGLPFSFLFMGGDQVNAWIGIFGFMWASVFMLFPLFNRDRLRAGDLIAGTWVLHSPKVKLAGDISQSSLASGQQGRFAFTPAQADAYGIHELHVLEQVLRNANADTRTEVADRIRAKISWARTPGERDIDFLEAYYAALRQRLEQRMLFGDRKEDKFDMR